MKVIWTRWALEDLDSAREYIALENPRAAVKIIERIEAAVNTLRSFPETGRMGRVEGTRELVISGTPFVIPYQIEKKQLEILGVIHGARRWPSRF